MSPISNQLIHETSPYLLQHAHNPVHWQVWGEAAFSLAKELNRPILVSVGYATCHWCHVMERESFENQATADFMNQYFICIKLDREERPDVDAALMEVVQMISGNGGWPLNCFLLPDARPFFAGTYFPDTPKYGRTTWLQLLENIQKAFAQRRAEVENQAVEIADYLAKTQLAFVKTTDLGFAFDANRANTADNYQIYDFFQTVFHNLRDNFDRINGGFGSAPKFPSTFALRFGLNLDFWQNTPDAAAHTHLSLAKMAQAGIYDQIGGGFARYATDAEWNVPHFEKMLYDNALLLSLYADAYVATDEPFLKNLYQKILTQTFDWLQREMKDPTGLYFSAIDADSEGKEGLFYLWDYQELENLLSKSEFGLLVELFDLQKTGNWEGKNILYYKNNSFSSANYKNQPLFDKNQQSKTLAQTLNSAAQKLLTARQQRIRPITDDKLMLDWNALLAVAFCRMYKSLGTENYLAAAQNILDNILNLYPISPAQPDLYHTYKLGRGKNPAFLDDYSCFIAAFLEFYQLNPQETYLAQAKIYADLVIRNFYDSKDKFFYLADAQSDAIARRKDLYDNATPSGNSVMAHNLLILSALLNDADYYQKAADLLGAVADTIKKFPQSFAHYADALLTLRAGLPLIIVVGQNYRAILTELRGCFLPNCIILGADKPKNLSHLPVAEGKIAPEGKTFLYFCRAQSCAAPVETVVELLLLIKS